jgi:acetate kinase
MNVLVLNAGSTSLKYDLYAMDVEHSLARGRVAHTGTDADMDRALAAVLAALAARPDASGAVDAIGHRVVHGGEQLVAPVVVDAAVEAEIEANAGYAPLHNPFCLAGIRAARRAFPQVPHVAVFDTAFHARMPPAAFLYGLPYDLYVTEGIRRYGFHGPSHHYMAACAAEHLGVDLARLRLITCHLGGGSSVAAIDRGVSVDTSMGMTPLEGLMMGTRAGDLDPAIPLLLARRGRSLDDLDALLNRRSGIAGLAGGTGDFRELEAAVARGEPRARLAFDVFVHRLRKYIGAYAAELGGFDALVFSGGIGEGSAAVRRQVCDRLGFLGIALDPALADARPADTGGVVDVSERRARTRVLVVATDEERMIARDVVRCLAGPAAAVHGARERPIPVGVSARHVHLSRADRERLFGPGYRLTRRHDVSQPGQYVTRETVDVVGPRGELHGVAIIDPERPQSQVELARTDAIRIGIDPPLRLSGELDGTPGVTLRGPAGSVALAGGVIVARRHLHLAPSDAAALGVADRDTIRARVAGDREMVLGDIVCRVDPRFALDLHLDTDEANAAGLTEASVVAFAGVEPRR